MGTAPIHNANLLGRNQSVIDKVAKSLKMFYSYRDLVLQQFIEIVFNVEPFLLKIYRKRFGEGRKDYRVDNVCTSDIHVRHSDHAMCFHFQMPRFLCVWLLRWMESVLEPENPGKSLASIPPPPPLFLMYYVNTEPPRSRGLNYNQVLYVPVSREVLGISLCKYHLSFS